MKTIKRLVLAWFVVSIAFQAIFFVVLYQYKFIALAISNFLIIGAQLFIFWRVLRVIKLLQELSKRSIFAIINSVIGIKSLKL